MSDLLRFLQNRNSAPRLTEPAPTDAEMSEIFMAATRVPDHAWLRPWRFLQIAGERRKDLGRVLARACLQRDPDTEQAKLDKASNAPLRAPLLVVVIARITPHPKVPALEQRLSAGCAAQAVLLAAEALGYAGVWRTGDAAFDRFVMDELGLAQHEEIIGFLYLGTRDGAAKQVPKLDTADFVTSW